MHYPNYQKRSFFRAPGWRWTRVLRIVNQLPIGRASRHDDEFVRQARIFALRRRAAEGDKNAEATLWFEYPDLFECFEFHRRLADNPEAAMYIKARLLAGQTFEMIAEVTGISPRAIGWYEALHFNVIDRLHERDWICNQILYPALRRPPFVHASGSPQGREEAQPFLDGSILAYAYFGGAKLVDLMLSGFVQMPPVATLDEINAWLDQHWSTSLRKCSVQAISRLGNNGFNVKELLGAHAKIIKLDRADDKPVLSSFEQNIKGLLDQIPFAAGDNGDLPHRGTVLPRLDKMAAELRDEELLARIIHLM